jgi:thymidine phosphorylase
VSASAGVLLRKKPGDAVSAGDVLMELRTEDAARIDSARELAAAAVTIADGAPGARPLILERLV